MNKSARVLLKTRELLNFFDGHEAEVDALAFADVAAPLAVVDAVDVHRFGADLGA